MGGFRLLSLYSISQLHGKGRPVAYIEERWVDIEGVAALINRVGHFFRFKLSEVDVWVKSGQAAESDTSDDKAT